MYAVVRRDTTLGRLCLNVIGCFHLIGVYKLGRGAVMKEDLSEAEKVLISTI